MLILNWLMKRRALVAVFTAVLLALVYWCVVRPCVDAPISTQSSLRGAAMLRAAPVFTLKDSSGVSHALDEWRGSAVVVHFWATWCPPCLKEIGEWVRLAERYKDGKVKLVAVSLDKNWKDVEKILPSSAVPAGVISLLDASGNTADRYASFRFPETYLLQPDLRILHKWVGPQDWNSPEVNALIEKALNSGLGESGLRQ